MAKNSSVNIITKCYTDTTSSGQATFNITDDETSSGNAIFSNITGISALALRDTTTAIQFLFCSLKSISSDKKQIVINVGSGTSLISLGNTVIDAPDGTTVYLTVFGN